MPPKTLRFGCFYPILATERCLTRFSVPLRLKPLYLPGGITYTLTVEDAADGKNSPSATPGFMGMNLPNTDILRKYSSDTTDVSLADSDIDTVRFTVAQTDWKPSAKTPGAATDPGALLNGIFDALTTSPNEKQ